MRLTHKRSVFHFDYTLGNSILQTTNSHPYLGVTITDKLTWNKHIDNITASANRTLGFIRRNLYSCPQHVKESAYKTLVRPLVEYSSSTWDPYTQVLNNKLEMVQRRAARFVSGDYKSKSQGCMTELLRQLDWESLQSRRKCRRLTILQKAITGHLSLPVGKLLQPAPRTSRHTNSQAFATLAATKDCYKNSYLPRTIRDWNSIPDSIAKRQEPNTFKAAIASHIYKQD
ncbi:uncharacterized protein [Amphiura filiformis]|uniref:uncharacterized protein n=1 Tax=Amphiura filiformis TaxID=82378 RepID=UPI003B214D69